MNFISSTFSFNMILPNISKGTIEFEAITPEEVPEDVKSLIHYNPAASVISSVLGRQIGCSNEALFPLSAGDTLYVAKISGGNLPSGTRVLPEGYSIQFIKLAIKD